MDKLIGITEARDRLRELIDEVKDHDVILLRHNRMEAVLIDPTRLEGLRRRIEDLEDLVTILKDRLEPEGEITQEEFERDLRRAHADS